MKLRVIVLGAGFGGLEISTMLSESLGEHLDLTLIDQNESFFFGFSKLDVMFGHKSSDAVKIPYHHLAWPGVRFRQETIAVIDPVKEMVTTDTGAYEADVLVVALAPTMILPQHQDSLKPMSFILIKVLRNCAAFFRILLKEMAL